MSDQTVLVTKGLTKRYGSLAALDSLDIEIKKGEIVGYLGPNGAGKTTTIRLLLGLIKPTSGHAEIFGLDCQKDKVKIHRRLAYVPGEASLWPSLTGEETLYLLGQIHGQVDLSYQKTLVKRFQFDPKKKVRTYSKGNRQKINLIAALATRADLLVLDEPTSGLDPLMEQAFRESILEAKKNGQTVFLSSHILDEVEALCDRVGILREGKLVEIGTLSEMRHLSALTVEATFAGKPPQIKKIKGVSRVKITGHHLSCQVQGPIDELLAALAKAKPKSLISREPSLEELFLSLYGDKDIRNRGTEE
ncbi:MAG TPA: ABC transporter ATP-binding protein [Candidatus Saccharimonadales bacterium]|nr:ABC transporter ATP-binding protein [Candidatus Saccharimonadales bacterium]